MSPAAVEKPQVWSLRWRRVMKAGAGYYAAEKIPDSSLEALFSPKDFLEDSPLGRGGGHFVHPEFGPLRLKSYRRGGIFGKLFPQYGLDEAAAIRELTAEQRLSGCGLTTQETLAVCVQSSGPKLRAIQRYFPDAVTFAELAAQKKLTDAQRNSVDELLQKIISTGYVHRDANGGNLLWDEAAARWRIIDLASAQPLGKMNPASALKIMHARLAKPPRPFRQ